MKLDDFMLYWSEVKDSFGLDYGRGGIRYTRADLIRGILEDKKLQLLDFATSLYAYDLFAQTLYTHNFLNQVGYMHWHSPELPGVTGLHSTSGRRVCPALLPTMLLYNPASDRCQSDDEPDRCFRVVPKELAVWMRNIGAFKARVDAVREEANFLIGVPQPRMSDEGAINLLQEKYMFEHQQLDAQIKLGESKRRVLNF